MTVVFGLRSFFILILLKHFIIKQNDPVLMYEVVLFIPIDL